MLVKITMQPSPHAFHKAPNTSNNSNNNNNNN